MSRYTPRPLTENEIEDIISGIEKMTYVIKSATDLAQQEVKNLLRKQLSSIELVPEAIPEMKRIIRNQYNRAVIEPQTPVGFLVSEALSQPITQMTLNSVIGETEIVIAENETKEAKVVHIGEWIDGLLKENKDKIVNIPENRTEYLELEKPVLIPSTTCDGHSEWMELTAVTRHLPVGDLVKIRTRSGREVTATSQKSFLVYDENQDKLVEKNGKDLKMGDYVGVHLGLENDECCSTLELQKYLPKTRWIYGSEIHKFKKLYDTDKVGRQVPKDWWSKHRNISFIIPLGRNDSIVKSVEYNDFEDGMIYPKMSNIIKSKIPETIPLDIEFGYILGLYLAEGHANKTTVIISNNAKEILEPVEKWCKKYNLGYHIQVQHDKNFQGATSTDLRIHSTLLASLFKEMMGTGSPNKRIPSESLNGPEEFIIGIIDGYISGDGSVSKQDGSISASSVSKTLIMGINFLLSKLGILSKMSGTQSLKNNIGSKNILYIHTISIRNTFSKIFADNIHLTSKSKHARIENTTKIIRLRTPYGRWYKKWRDIVLDPIVSIESIPSEDRNVYDVTVPKSLNFNIFNGLIMAD